MILRQELFWEYDINALQLDADEQVIVPRIAMRGRVDDIRFLFRHYGMERIKNILLQVPYLDKYTLSLFSLLLNEPQENFRCYKRKQLNQPFWNF